jgi:hypothetical protein
MLAAELDRDRTGPELAPDALQVRNLGQLTFAVDEEPLPLVPPAGCPP